MRIIAWLIMIIPGIIAGIGIKWMRDTFFGVLNNYFPFLWLQFTVGLLAFLFGMTFIGSFIYHREKKRKQKRNMNH